MEAKCLRVEDILSQAKKSLGIGLGIGFAIGCSLIIVAVVLYRNLAPRLKRCTTNNDAASKGGQPLIQKKVLRPSRRKLEQQRSDSTTTSNENQSERYGYTHHGGLTVPNQEEAQGLGRKSPLKPSHKNSNASQSPANGYEDVDDLYACVDGYRANDTSEYVTFDGNSYSNRYMNYSNEKSHPEEDTHPTYANITGSNDETYDYVASSSVAQALASGQQQTPHGYLFMGNVPQEIQHSRHPH